MKWVNPFYANVLCYFDPFKYFLFSISGSMEIKGSSGVFRTFRINIRYRMQVFCSLKLYKNWISWWMFSWDHSEVRIATDFEGVIALKTAFHS